MTNPVVPDVPGVPPLVRSGPAPASPPLLQGDTLASVGQSVFPKWGLFLNGEQVLFPDSVVTFSFKQDYELLDYPVEEGGFETYNKVIIPSEIQMRVAKGGAESNRAALIDTIDGLAQTLDLYTVVTPEASYLDYNIERYDYKRTNDNGVGMIIIDIHLRQVRVVTVPEFSQTAAPSGADATQQGALQPVPASTTQAMQIFSLFNNQQQPALPGSPVNTFPNNSITLFPQNGAGF